MNGVAIIGVGLHPFGRFEGKSAVEMGADAIRLDGQASTRRLHRSSPVHVVRQTAALGGE